MRHLTPCLLATALVLTGCGQTPPQTSEASPAAEESSMTPAQDLCLDDGPQTPRDISSTAGLNMDDFEMAPASTEMNLCNLHTHTQAEHKGPGFSVFVGDDVHGGYACNDAETLTEAELSEPAGERAYGNVKPGDTIEVHWVYSSCANVVPGEGLGSCVPDGCTDPLLRVEAQVFLVVNDPEAPSFLDYAYAGTLRNGLHQPKALPADTGSPVVFRGSTTGPSFDQSNCSKLKVTWSVRPQCARIDISSLDGWATSDNVFNETRSQGVRQLVTAPELLSPIG